MATKAAIRTFLEQHVLDHDEQVVADAITVLVDGIYSNQKAFRDEVVVVGLRDAMSGPIKILKRAGSPPIGGVDALRRLMILNDGDI